MAAESDALSCSCVQPSLQSSPMLVHIHAAVHIVAAVCSDHSWSMRVSECSCAHQCVRNVGCLASSSVKECCAQWIASEASTCAWSALSTQLKDGCFQVHCILVTRNAGRTDSLQQAAATRVTHCCSDFMPEEQWCWGDCQHHPNIIAATPVEFKEPVLRGFSEVSARQSSLSGAFTLQL